MAPWFPAHLILGAGSQKTRMSGGQTAPGFLEFPSRLRTPEFLASYRMNASCSPPSTVRICPVVLLSRLLTRRK